MWAIQHVLQYLKAWFEILVNTDISILGFYEYIGNIGKISVDILTKILVKQKLFKIHENVWKTLKKNNKISKNTYVKVIVSGIDISMVNEKNIMGYISLNNLLFILSN